MQNYLKIRHDTRWAVWSDNRFMVRASKAFWIAVIDSSVRQCGIIENLKQSPEKRQIVLGRGR